MDKTTPALAGSTANLAAWTEKHPKLGISLIDHLWNRLDGLYPNKWRAAFANAQAIENWRASWIEAFADEGIQPHEIATAIGACRRLYDWPPSLTEFLRACRPMADAQTEWAEAREQMRIRILGEGRDRWSRPEVYWAANAIGWFDLNALAWEQIRGRWTAALKNARRDPVPRYAEALPAPGQTTPPKEVVEANLEKLRGLLGGLDLSMDRAGKGEADGQA